MYYIYALRKQRYNNYAERKFYEVVYVGQSKNVKRRIKQHKDKKFDDYVILEECETLKEAKEIENFYIKRYDPEYNKSLNFHGAYGTLKENFEYLSKHNMNFEINDIYEMMDISLRSELKPIFSNKYSYFDFYNVVKKWDHYKQSGGAIDG